MTSARIKPRSKSEWILPAACGALVPFSMVQARTSCSPGGQVAHQAEQIVADLDQAVKTGLMQTQLGQEHLLLLCVHACDILFELCTDRQDHCALRVRDSLYSLEALIFFVVAGKAFLVHVGRVDDLLCGQQVALVYDAVDILVLAEALKGAGGLALLEMCLELFQNVYVEQQLLVCLGQPCACAPDGVPDARCPQE